METYKKILRKHIRNIINESLMSENVIVPPDIPNTQNFWHGGNLDDYNDIIAQKTGRYEWGPGLYITTHYDTAKNTQKAVENYILSL
jgi:hypothetical protein